MAETALSQGNEVRIDGLAEVDLSGVTRRLFHGAVDLSPFCGPNGSINAVRELSARRIENPKYSEWQNAVNTLFADIETAENAVKGINLAGHVLRNIGPTLPNPDYEIPREDDRGSMIYSPHKKYNFLSRAGLMHVILPENRAQYPNGFGELAVTLRFGAPAGISPPARPNSSHDIWHDRGQ